MTSATQQFLTLDEYRSFADEFTSTGIMHGNLFEHLLQTETEFVEKAAMRVAANILLTFRIMYHTKLNNEENCYIVPYFCKEFLSDNLPNTGSCVTFHAQLRFDGLSLPQYAYHQLAVYMLNSFSQDSDSISIGNNGARVVNKDVTYQLVHDYKSGIVNIRVSFDSSQVCRAWKVLVDITNSSIEYVETRWCACKIGCKFFCSHCGLEKHPHPSKLMNPSWVHYHANREKFSLPPSETKHFSCEKDPSVPECLLNPCPSLSEEQKEDLSKFLSKYKQSSSSEDETQVESDAESDLSDHEDFFLPGEEHNVKMEVSATRRENIKRLFYSNQFYVTLAIATIPQVYRMSETARGKALIINNNVFPGYPKLKRTGSSVDVTNTLAVLRNLDFEVDVKYNRTAEVNWLLLLPSHNYTL
ncbi:hypothetical protein EB796_017806 [Bugula neritina]|uniref:Caspase family p20 domain-containing protein n=1 Tax=Bugula neritina TaxID=10212 RepID=A0A7J7JCQ8_BUGNE|nr:hypothetical protein EB796_017806 [Bugula neritina]